MDNTSQLSDQSASRLRLIREFVEIQRNLIAVFVSQLPQSVTEFNFKQHAPSLIRVEDVPWEIKPHGAGVMFKNSVSRVVIDSHIGFLSAPSAFDAWRMVEYDESKNRVKQEIKSWQNTLEELFQLGEIARCDAYPGHFTLIVSVD